MTDMERWLVESKDRQPLGLIVLPRVREGFLDLDRLGDHLPEGCHAVLWTDDYQEVTGA